MGEDRYERWQKASTQAQGAIRELVALGTIEWPYESERELAEEVKALREQLEGAGRLRQWITHFDTMTNDPRLRSGFASALSGDEPPVEGQ